MFQHFESDVADKVLQLHCSCNEYPWGKQGSSSLAARLCAGMPESDFEIDESKPYAEMWMGTYPDLPSYLRETGEDLQTVLDRHPKELIGDNVINKFGHTNLPFLPKVLSIAKALPLQLHPNKTLASKLHKQNPSQFTDPNHKPEIALALGDFEAFVGFKPLSDIHRLLQLPPLKPFLPSESAAAFDDQALKHVVHAMLSASEETIKTTNEQLLTLSRSDFGKDRHIPDLIPRLAAQYDKTDNGTIVALITMNYLQLKAGDSIYIPADGIHAYLSGDIIECMARSNNVLNTGFCPRADRDSVDMFCDVLTFKPHDAQAAMLPSSIFDRCKNGKVKLYAPPLSEFKMLAMELEEGETETLEELNGPSIMIVTKGRGEMRVIERQYQLREGYVFFIAHGVDMEIEAEEGALQVFTAFVE